MSEDELQGKLALIRENLERLAQIPQGSYEEFDSDFRRIPDAALGQPATVKE